MQKGVYHLSLANKMEGAGCLVRNTKFVDASRVTCAFTGSRSSVGLGFMISESASALMLPPFGRVVTFQCSSGGTFEYYVRVQVGGVGNVDSVVETGRVGQGDRWSGSGQLLPHQKNLPCF